MALVCINGGKECTGCGRCEPAPECSSCQVAIGRGQEYYEGTFGVICAACVGREIRETETVCGLCGEVISSGEEIICLLSLTVCGECAERCIR